MSIISVRCPIWNTESFEIHQDLKFDGAVFDSPRAGGKFRIADTVMSVIKQKLPSDLVFRRSLSTYIVYQNRLGNLPTITSHTIDDLNLELPDIESRKQLLLEYFYSHSLHLGKRLEFSNQHETYPESAAIIGYLTQASKGFQPLYAWSSSIEADEVSFLLDILLADGLLDHLSISSLDVERYKLTPKGYLYFQKEKTSKQAFVAMWFDGQMNDAYSSGVEPAIRHAGFSPMRIDKKEHANKIDDEIIAEIRRSRFLIADFTSERDKPRGGVYFEAGFAMGLGIPVIWTCHEDLIDQVHFDTRQYNHIVWKTPDELKEKLYNRIRAVIV
jgi:hypothetical protein